MRTIAAATSLVALVALGACKKTGEGTYQVQTPDVNVSTDTSTVKTPTVDVQKDTITVPKVEVETPAERQGTTP